MGLFLPMADIQVLFSISCVVSHVSPHTCGTQMTDGTAMLNML